MSISANSNIGDTDRYIRIAIGCALVIWGLLGGPLWGFLLGGLVLATALIRICPFYSIFKMNTLGTKKE
jgi:hypothetical protein